MVSGDGLAGGAACPNDMEVDDCFLVEAAPIDADWGVPGDIPLAADEWIVVESGLLATDCVPFGLGGASLA